MTEKSLVKYLGYMITYVIEYKLLILSSRIISYCLQQRWYIDRPKTKWKQCGVSNLLTNYKNIWWHLIYISTKEAILLATYL